MDTIILMTLVVIAILIILIIKEYNKIIKLQNKVKSSESGIDIYLNQRFDLIPNLVECVKGYSKHEKKIFTEIADLRSSYMNQNKNIKSAENLNNKMNQLIAVAENYPELKASEQYLNLQKTLTKLEVVPSNIIASLFGFNPAQLFEIEEYKRENISIKFED